MEYCKLFNLLVARGIPPVIIRLLLNMYTDKHVRVLWNGEFSNVFGVENGVKQGGVSSDKVMVSRSNQSITDKSPQRTKRALNEID